MRWGVFLPLLLVISVLGRVYVTPTVSRSGWNSSRALMSLVPIKYTVLRPSLPTGIFLKNYFVCSIFKFYFWLVSENLVFFNIEFFSSFKFIADVESKSGIINKQLWFFVVYILRMSAEYSDKPLASYKYIVLIYLFRIWWFSDYCRIILLTVSVWSMAFFRGSYLSYDAYKLLSFVFLTLRHYLMKNACHWTPKRPIKIFCNNLCHSRQNYLLLTTLSVLHNYLLCYSKRFSVKLQF